MSETCASSGGESSKACGVRETFQRRNSLHSAPRSSATASSLRDIQQWGARVSLGGLYLQETDRAFRGEAGNVVSGAVTVLLGYPAHITGKIGAARGIKPDGDSGHPVVTLRQRVVGERWRWFDSQGHRIGLKCGCPVQPTRVAVQPPGDGIFKGRLDVVRGKVTWQPGVTEPLEDATEVAPLVLDWLLFERLSRRSMS